MEGSSASGRELVRPWNGDPRRVAPSPPRDALPPSCSLSEAPLAPAPSRGGGSQAPPPSLHPRGVASAGAGGCRGTHGAQTCHPATSTRSPRAGGGDILVRGECGGTQSLGWTKQSLHGISARQRLRSRAQPPDEGPAPGGGMAGGGHPHLEGGCCTSAARHASPGWPQRFGGWGQGEGRQWRLTEESRAGCGAGKGGLWLRSSSRL